MSAGCTAVPTVLHRRQWTEGHGEINVQRKWTYEAARVLLLSPEIDQEMSLRLGSWFCPKVWVTNAWHTILLWEKRFMREEDYEQGRKIFHSGTGTKINRPLETFYHVESKILPQEQIFARDTGGYFSGKGNPIMGHHARLPVEGRGIITRHWLVDFVLSVKEKAVPVYE